MKNIILMGITALSVIVFILSVLSIECTDSLTVPTILCALSLAWLGVFSLANSERR